MCTNSSSDLSHSGSVKKFADSPNVSVPVPPTPRRTAARCDSTLTLRPPRLCPPRISTPRDPNADLTALAYVSSSSYVPHLLRPLSTSALFTSGVVACVVRSSTLE